MIHFNVDNPLYKLFSALRAPITRFFKPRGSYFIFRTPQRHLTPISSKFGFDRGTPVDRYYIEQFIKQNQDAIRGECLEVHDDAYLTRYGKEKVTRREILDFDTTNRLATVYGDLRNLHNIADNSYDCLVITQTFGLLDTVETSVKECFRVLKPGGTLLATFSTLGPLRKQEQTYWRFTTLSVKYLFGKIFKPEHISITTFGNVLACQCFLVGLAAEELSPEELSTPDFRYPLIIGLKAVKK